MGVASRPAIAVGHRQQKTRRVSKDKVHVHSNVVGPSRGNRVLLPQLWSFSLYVEFLSFSEAHALQL